MRNNAQQCATMRNNAQQCATMRNNAQQCATMRNNAQACATVDKSMSDTYLRGVIRKYAVNETAVKQTANQVLYPVIKQWAGNYLVSVSYSGSIAKGTAVSLSADADIFISLSSSLNSTLKHIFQSLCNTLLARRANIRKQNVSVRVTIGSFKYDLIPGRRQSQYSNDHSLYKSRSDTWTKTNVETHIAYVKNSGRLEEIKITKIWRELHQIEFPSFYLEMAVIDALRRKKTNQLSENFLVVLNFIATEFVNKRYVDPANTNNIISDDLTYAEKMIVKNKAASMLTKSQFSQIVW